MTDSHAPFLHACSAVRARSASLPSPSPSPCALTSARAWAVEPFVLKDIRVEGLQRTDAGTVFAALPFRIGDTYTDDKGAAALRALFATGLFKDVRIDIDDGVAVVIVDERSVIASIDFVGMKEFEKDALIKSLKDFGIGEGLPFDKALADRAEQELKRQYLTRSLYGAEVVTTVTPQERNRVNVTFTVTEGAPAKIREIRIVGNKVFSEGTLKGLFELNDGGWLNFYLKNDRYSRAKLNADLETLRAYYLNRGYLEFEIESTQVAISPDKQDITITINVKEGQPYTVTGGPARGRVPRQGGRVQVAGDDPAGRAVSRRGRRRDHPRLRRPLRHLRLRLRQGRLPARDRPRQAARSSSRWPPSRSAASTCAASTSPATRAPATKSSGASSASSSRPGTTAARSSCRATASTGSATSARSTSRRNEVPGTHDQVDLTITIKEKPTGTLSVGAGYSSADKLSLTASIKQENIFGSGNYLGLEVNTSKYNRTLVAQHGRPVLHDRRHLARASTSTTAPPGRSTARARSTSSSRRASSMRFGVPFSEYDTVFFGVGVERTEIKARHAACRNSYFLYREQFGETSTSVPLTIGWSRDSRDSALVPTAGRYTRVNLDWASLGDARYLRVNLQGQQYIPLTRAFTFGVNAEIGYGKGLGGRPYPIFKNFYGGGLGTVRGFDQGSLGPVDVTGAYIGGNRRFNLNNELYLPVPGAERRPDPAHLRLRRRRQRLGREREDHARQPARLGRPGRQLDLPGRPAQAQLRHADAQAAGR